jgi:hypothetical protein
MFCSACGNKVNANLSYCNKCGARLGPSKGENSWLPESSINLLIGALIGVPILGTALLIGLMYVMKKELGFAEEWIIIALLFCVLLFLLTEAGILWLFFSRVRSAKTESEKLPEQRSLSSDPTRMLNEPRSTPVSAVSEDTTRVLEPANRNPDE